ncbi:hypothetical protein Goari_016220 [Gossypium aridum]|uniref:ubiquitinyl hydrolase 1 n=1 Tax=Gossypium aridum TaxID=34290 RepID=A0A7J8WHV2_GOSAI|nr:hypothetical protein [Gossypium aridum]
MLEDGNCVFRAVADQVYRDFEAYHLVHQMCIDYMVIVSAFNLSDEYDQSFGFEDERERDHFSQFITEGFTSNCKRKRRDKVYGSNVEIQALSEMYNRPIHIYSYSIEPFNVFHGSYHTDTPPIRLRQSWRRGGSTLIWSLLRRKSSEWAEYLGNDKFKMHVERASTAEPSSSGAISESSKVEGSKEQVLSSWMELVLSMGFSYLQAIEA